MDARGTPQGEPGSPTPVERTAMLPRTTNPLYGLSVLALLGGLALLPQPGSAPTTTASSAPAPAIELRHTLAPPAPAVTTPAPAPRTTAPRPIRRSVAPRTRTAAAPPAHRATHRAAYRQRHRTTGAPGSARAYALTHLSAAQYICIDAVFTRESGWSTSAQNPSGAFGIPQALPGSKMASAGADWRTNGATQVRWGISYMDAQYGSPCGAWEFWQSHHWY